MNCRTALARTVALADGELAPAMAARVRKHLTECPECARAAGEAERVAWLAAAWVETGGKVWEAVSAAIGTTDIEQLTESVHALEAEVRALRTQVAMLRAEASSAQSMAVRAGAGTRSTWAARPRPCLRIV